MKSNVWKITAITSGLEGDVVPVTYRNDAATALCLRLEAAV
jgi:hypothetical protein